MRDFVPFLKVQYSVSSLGFSDYMAEQFTEASVQKGIANNFY